MRSRGHKLLPQVNTKCRKERKELVGNGAEGQQREHPNHLDRDWPMGIAG